MEISPLVAQKAPTFFPNKKNDGMFNQANPTSLPLFLNK